MPPEPRSPRLRRRPASAQDHGHTQLLLSVPAVRVTSHSSPILQQEQLFLKTNPIELIFCLKFLSGSLWLSGYSLHFLVHTHKPLHKLVPWGYPKVTDPTLGTASGGQTTAVWPRGLREAAPLNSYLGHVGSGLCHRRDERKTLLAPACRIAIGTN